MPYLSIGPDNAVLEVLPKDAPGLIFIKDIAPIVEHAHGHCCFDFVSGGLVLNVSRHDALVLEQEKGFARQSLIAVEMRRQAALALETELRAIDAATTVEDVKRAHHEAMTARAAVGRP